MLLHEEKKKKSYIKKNPKNIKSDKLIGIPHGALSFRLAARELAVFLQESRRNRPEIWPNLW